MKYCPKCGLETESNYCPNCGTPMREKTPRCPRCGTEANSKFCPNCGAAMSGSTGYSTGSGSYSPPPPTQTQSPSGGSYRSYESSAPDPSSYKLGWHKFLIYFGLWCAALLDIGNGIQTIQAASNIARYGGSSTPFLLLGAATIALGVFAIYVRFQLAGFKRGAPKKLLIAVGATLAINVVSQLAISSLLPYSDSEGMISAIAGGVVAFIICWKYYSSREELFVN